MVFHLIFLRLTVFAAASSNAGMWGGFVNFLSSILTSISNLTNNYGLAVVIFTILFRLVLLPLDLKAKASTQKMNEIQPKIQEINKKYKNDPEKRNKKTLELYKKYNVNPLGGCLPMLLQLPVFFALFAALRQISNGELEFIKSVVQQHNFKPEDVVMWIQKEHPEYIFLWIKNIWVADSPFLDVVGNPVGFMAPNWNGLFILPILAGVTSYYQSKLMNPNPNSEQSGFTAIFPLLSVWFCSMYTAAFAVYWVTSNIFQIAYLVIYNRIARLNSPVKEGDDG